MRIAHAPHAAVHAAMHWPTAAAAVPLAAAYHAPEGPSRSTPAEVFASMQTSFHAAAAKGVNAKYQFDLSGPHGGRWYIEVADDTFQIHQGTIASPDVTFACADDDWVRMTNGRENPVLAYMTGHVQVQGSKELVHRLFDMFN